MIARASHWTASEVAAAVGGRLTGPDVAIAGVSTDTRDALNEHLFVALTGERFDAHDFAANAVAGGASALLVSRAVEHPRHVAVVTVGDTLRALGELAKTHRARMPAAVVALTGSNGKTTTKNMLAAILSVRRRTLATEGNLNNLIGVPMTLLGLAEEHEAIVVEMGMNAEGEIARYTEIADPDVGMVINVGPAHIGMLGSLEAIARAKAELLRGLRPGAVAVVNADDPYVVRAAVGLEHAITFGRGEAHVVLARAEPDGSGQRIEVVAGGERASIHIPFEGEHNAMNATAAIAAACALGVPLSDAAAGLPSSAKASRRLAYAEVGPYLVVDDCYNANRASMAAAIETVSARAAREGRRFVALLGEMRELGDFSDEEHRRVGELAGRRAAIVAAFGPLAGGIAHASPATSMHEADDPERLFRWLLPRLEAGDVILVKGSRGIRMERFIELLEAEV